MRSAPDNLRLQDGRLRMKNRSSVRKYLQGWQIVRGLPDDWAVCLMRQEDLDRLYKRIRDLENELNFYKELTVSA